jgi:UDP-glucose 4-epimerase
MSILITGAAGFVGCNLARAFIERGRRVIAIDNMSRGTLRNLTGLAELPEFVLEVIDIADADALTEAMARHHRQQPITEVWHLAANSDIPAGVNDPVVDLRDTFITTFNLLGVMRELKVPVLAFASSAAIYGERPELTLAESTGPCFPISNYGAMKLASEAAISAAVESHLTQAFICRFPNVVGAPATHGVIYDFLRKLGETPKRLEVLGNGSQQKAYLHVDDLVQAMLFLRDHATERVSCFNIGADDDGVTVRFIAEETVSVVAPGADIVYGEADRGWVGDVPRFALSVEKLHALGWRPRTGSREAVRRAIREIAAQSP